MASGGILPGSPVVNFSHSPISVQNQVDEVIDVMQENITKVIERGERLDELQDKSGTLRFMLGLVVCAFVASVAILFIFF